MENDNIFEEYEEFSQKMYEKNIKEHDFCEEYEAGDLNENN